MVCWLRDRVPKEVYLRLQGWVLWGTQLVQWENYSGKILELHQQEGKWSPILANWVLVSALNKSRHCFDGNVIWDQVYNGDLYRVRTCDLIFLMWALKYNLYLHYLKCRITVTHSGCQVTTKNYCELKVTWNADVQLLSNVSCKEQNALYQLLWKCTCRQQE